nr:MAG TPA: hypothetical protein [Caudoviricetes sp.]
MRCKIFFELLEALTGNQQRTSTFNDYPLWSSFITKRSGKPSIILEVKI